jgi:hypothetical protein
MKRARIYLIFLIIPLSIPNIIPVFACTIFTDSQGDQVLFAGNEDQSPNESYLLVDTEGTIGVVYLATPWQELPLIPQMGMNEQGLCYDSNWIPNEALNSGTDFTRYEEWPVPHLMRECSTVEEVLAKAFDYNWGSSISYQMHFADANGDAAVIHPGSEGELTYTRKPSGDGYLVSTNFNLEMLKSGDYNCERYTTANDMLNAGHELTVDFMVSILDATHAEGRVSTIFSAVFDPTRDTIYLYYNHRFDSPIILSVEEQVASGARQLTLEELFEDLPSQGLIPQQMVTLMALLGIVLIGFFIYHRQRQILIT